jgi:N-succinyl-L-ornithine transcarbamylase
LGSASQSITTAVANSFVEMMQLQDADFVITHPEGYELNPEITKDSVIEYDQNKALKMPTLSIQN